MLGVHRKKTFFEVVNKTKIIGLDYYGIISLILRENVTFII